MRKASERSQLIHREQFWTSVGIVGSNAFLMAQGRETNAAQLFYFPHYPLLLFFLCRFGLVQACAGGDGPTDEENSTYSDEDVPSLSDEDHPQLSVLTPHPGRVGE